MVAQRKAFPLRMDPAVYSALQRWADSELRSLNAQIEFLLRRALRDAGRLQDSVPPVARENDAGEDDAREDNNDPSNTNPE